MCHVLSILARDFVPKSPRNVGKRAILRGVLTPEERGPAAAWAYETRTLLELSVEQVIARLPTKYDPATLRKAEGRNGKPSRQMWRELKALYEAAARKKGVAIAPQPALAAGKQQVATLDDLVAAITAQTEAINRAMDYLLGITRPEGETESGAEAPAQRDPLSVREVAATAASAVHREIAHLGDRAARPAGDTPAQLPRGRRGPTRP